MLLEKLNLVKIKLNLMEKLIGHKIIRTAVFISGTGSNLKNLIKFSKTKKSPISIDLVISNTNRCSKRFKVCKSI